MKKADIDPAALLIAIVPVAVSPLTMIGAWDKLNTVVAAIVLIVLWAYTIGGGRRYSPRSLAECSAIGSVMGLISAILVAWPIQYLWILGGETNQEPDFVAADDSTWTGLLLGLVVAIALTVFLWRTSVIAQQSAATNVKRSAPPLYKKSR